MLITQKILKVIPKINRILLLKIIINKLILIEIKHITLKICNNNNNNKSKNNNINNNNCGSGKKKRVKQSLNIYHYCVYRVNTIIA